MRMFKIGRDIHNDYVVSDGFASSFHCQIMQYDDRTCHVADLGSLNGTYVNGIRIYGETILRPTDILRVGNSTIPWQSMLSGDRGISYYPGRPGPGFGITALCCGVLGFGILAVIFGAIGMHRNERLKGMAIAGLVLGILWTLFSLTVLIVALAE